MIGNIDGPDDFLATGLCLRAGISAPGQDSRSFLAGHRLGFLMGFLAAQRYSLGSARKAYQSLIASIRAEDAL